MCQKKYLTFYLTCIVFVLYICTQQKTYTSMQLTEKAIQVIQHRDGLNIRNRLAYELKKSYATIERWLEDASNGTGERGVMLTTAQALQIIREETGLTDAEILTQESAQA